MLKRGSKRGFSKTAAIFMFVFVILLVVAFIVIKKVVIDENEQNTLGKYTLDLELSQVQIKDNNSLLILVKRNIGKGEFIGMEFIMDDGKHTETILVNETLDELGSKIFLFPLNITNASRMKKVSLSPVFEFEIKERKIGNIQIKKGDLDNMGDEYIFGSSGTTNCIIYCPSGAECGDDGCGGQCAGGCTQEGYICFNSKCIPSLETKCGRTIVNINQVSNVTNNYSVVLSRGDSGEDQMGGVKLVFTNEGGLSSFVIDVEGNLAPFEQVTKYVLILEEHLENPKNIQTIVYFIDENEMEEVCKPSIKFSFQ
jgi:hypothetical protein